MAIGDLFERGYLKQVGNFYLIKTFMPFPLKENNSILAEGIDGWIVIDTGVNLGINQNIWQAALKQIGISFRNISTIYLTHYHHDHLGLAGWFQQHGNIEVFLPYQDLNIFNTYVSSHTYFEAVKNTCLMEGWSKGLIIDLAQDIKNIDSLITPYPELTPLYPGHSFYLGTDRYFSIHVPGHTDGHYMFYSPDSQVLFSGDNVVGHTILHLTDWPHTNLLSPLDVHLASLNQILEYEVRIVASGHGEIFTNLKERLELIERYHEKKKAMVYQGIIGPTSAWDLSCCLYKPSNYIHIKRLQLAETLAYLNALVYEGTLEKDCIKGINIYKKKKYDFS